MTTKSLLRTTVRTEYALLRAPLTVLDRQLVARCLDETSRVRQSFERILLTLDSVATAVLGGGEGGGEGAGHGGGGARPQQRPLPEDEVEEIDQLTDELLDQQDVQVFTGELADDDLRQVQAELRAKHLVEEQEATREGR